MTACTCDRDVCALHDHEADVLAADIDAYDRFWASLTVDVSRDGGPPRRVFGPLE